MTTTQDLILDPKLLAEAERLGIDVRRSVEADLRRRIDTARRAAAWQEENNAAIDEANRELEENGLWYERLGKA